MLRPSSLPLGIRSVEWVRTHHGAWLVNETENIWYTWHAPKKGGPPLRTLPTVGVGSGRARPERSAGTGRARIAPVIRPALPGEGVWRSTERVVAGAPPVLVTTFRTDPVYPRIVAYVAWFDHTRTQLALYPGRYEPPNASPRGPMEVPQSQRWRLLATFNSGFMNRDSHGGFFVDGHSAAPLRPGQGTIVAYKDGRVDVFSWHGRRDSRPEGRPGPAEPAADRRPGPAESRCSRTTRSGEARSGTRCGSGDPAPESTATATSSTSQPRTRRQRASRVALMHAGAVRAVELDINAEWPSLVTYGRGGVGNATKVVPNYQQSTNRYLVPDDRDFFAVYRRTTAGGPAERSVWLSQPELRARAISRSNGAQKMCRASASERCAES